MRLTPESAVHFAAVEDVLRERQAQLSREGYSLEHDDRHGKGEMAYAAAAYALSSVSDLNPAGLSSDIWPWRPTEFKPAGARRDLVRAAALIIAEIERRDRAIRNLK